jgi:hypothetical protein
MVPSLSMVAVVVADAGLVISMMPVRVQDENVYPELAFAWMFTVWP